MTEHYSGFCAWSAPFLQKWTKIQRAFWLNPHKSIDNWGEAGTKIGSSAHRPIDPSVEREVVLRWPDEPMVRCSHCLASPLCTSKQKGLAINSENCAKIYIVENKTLSKILVAGRRKNAGGKNEGIFHYVIENKWWKNVRKQPLHYVDEKTGGYSSLSIILMKRKDVIQKAVMSDE